MEIYRDADGDSGVKEYQIGDDQILVRFRNGVIYTYTYASAGSGPIETMKVLARAGNGLNAYIVKNRVKYASKS